MVPTGMIKKMYGPSIYTDEVLKTVERQLHSFLDTEKPDIFAQPLALDTDIRKLDLNNPSDYEFGFEIGLKPDFEVAPLDTAPVNYNKVKVTEEMVQEEVDRLQTKAGDFTETDRIEDQEDILNILFTECDQDGQPIPGGTGKENSLLLKYFKPAVQEQLIGKTKEDTIVIQPGKAFEEDKLQAILQDLGFEKDDKAAADKYFQLTIVKIGLIEKRPLNEEFFNEVFTDASVATEEEFRDKLKESLEQYWDSQSRNQLHDQLYHYMLDETKIEFPAQFLKRWLQTGSNEPKTAEQAEEEFPVFSSQLKWTLISDKIIKENNIQVTPEELQESMKSEIMRYFGNMSMGGDTSWIKSYVDKMMKDEKQLDATYRKLLTAKVFAFAESQVKPEQKEVSAEELIAMQHNHHH
jgi:trigger factor